ncbi:MAG: biotin/lipoyl-binding protein [Clostridia bacterium]|nr:biotin/lipoyl-binding protein [Clostridia bacterium]
MRKFNITVNGTTYEVDVEEVGGVQTAAPVYTAPAAAPAPTAAPAPAAAPTSAAAPKAAPAAAPAGASTIDAPMPGTIVSVKVNVGDTVKSGDLVAILEAMKMENEIFSNVDGKVVAVNAAAGASVNTGDAIVSIG